MLSYIDMRKHRCMLQVPHCTHRNRRSRCRTATHVSCGLCESFRGVVIPLVPCVHGQYAALQARQQSATGSIDSLPISVATAATAATTTEGTSSSEVRLPLRFAAAAALRRTSAEAPKRLRFSWIFLFEFTTKVFLQLLN